MKIGMITWYKDENYGTKLQAMALYSFLKMQNNDVELIDFETDSRYPLLQKETYGSWIRKQMQEKNSWRLLNLLKKIYKSSFDSRSKSFQKFIISNCTISPKVTTDEDYIRLCNTYDLLVFGSDQIWNPEWFHPYYFAAFDSISTKRISYAPSMGVSSVPESRVELLKDSINRFDKISLREIDGVKIVEEITDKKAQLVLDPTLLLTKEQWSNFEKSVPLENEKYILCYFLIDNPNHWRAAKKFAKTMGLKIKVIPIRGFSFFKEKNINKEISIENFLYLFHNAEYVITDSYHGTIFSIIYQKNFTSFCRTDTRSKSSQNSRLYSLLGQLGLESNLLNFDTKKIKLKSEIDYNLVNERLSKLKNISTDYLINAIQLKHKME